MIMICHGLVDQQWIDDINNEMFAAEREKLLNYEGVDTRYLGNSYGRGDMVNAARLLEHLTPMIRGAYGDVRPSHSYSRIYYNGSVLNPHVDRPGLDITLTLCTYSDIDVEWPLYVEFKDVTYAVLTPVGSAAVIRGTEYNHYREKLVCAEGQKVVQTFLHWTKNS